MITLFFDYKFGVACFIWKETPAKWPYLKSSTILRITSTNDSPNFDDLSGDQPKPDPAGLHCP